MKNKYTVMVEISDTVSITILMGKEHACAISDIVQTLNELLSPVDGEQDGFDLVGLEYPFVLDILATDVRSARKFFFASEVAAFDAACKVEDAEWCFYERLDRKPGGMRRTIKFSQNYIPF